MAIVDLLMPKMGESIMEATILKWNKQPGDFIEQDESLLEIATDKVDSEVPTIAAGILKEILFPENAVVPVGAVIAKIETEVNAFSAPNAEHLTPDTLQLIASEDPSTLSAQRLTPDHLEPSVTGHRSSVVEKTGNCQRPTTNENRFYSPLVLNIANNEGIPLSELEKIPGTGNEGRVTKKDILFYVDTRKDGNGFHTRDSVSEPAYSTYGKESKTNSGG